MEESDAAYEWVRLRYEELFGPSYVDQCCDAGMWDTRELVPECDKWLNCRRVRFGTKVSETAGEQLAAINARAGTKTLTEFPPGMALVTHGWCDVKLPSKSLLGRLLIPAKVQKKYDELEAGLADMAEKMRSEIDVEAGALVDEMESTEESNAQQKEDLVHELEQLQLAADEYQDVLQEFERAMKNKRHKKDIKDEDGCSKLGLLLAGQMVLNEGEGNYENTDSILTKYQRPDRIPRDRCRRFIKYVLQDGGVAMREGHDVTLGSCFDIWWGGKDSFAVVRVLQMYDDDNHLQQKFSLKLNKTIKKQQFRVEVLLAVGHTEAGSQRYRASGWQVGPIAGTLVIGHVNLLPMRDMVDIPREQKIHDALLPVEQIHKLQKQGLKQCTTDENGMICATASTRSGSQLLVKNLEGWDAHHRCYWCKTSWYDHTTGLIVKCTKCPRSFEKRQVAPRPRGEGRLVTTHGWS